MFSNLPPIVLASSSPRRAELLRQLGLDFTVVAPRVDERTIGGDGTNDLAVQLACAKADDVAMQVAGQEPRKLIIAADTVVTHAGKRLDKPTKKDEAVALLRTLSGSSHSVTTGICLMLGKERKVLSALSRVTFAELTEGEIEYYIATQPPYDKAGGYGIQDWIGTARIAAIEGSYTNIVGLPTCQLYEALRSIASGTDPDIRL